jgi:hypothetical protein
VKDTLRNDAEIPVANLYFFVSAARSISVTVDADDLM